MNNAFRAATLAAIFATTSSGAIAADYGYEVGIGSGLRSVVIFRSDGVFVTTSPYYTGLNDRTVVVRLSPKGGKSCKNRAPFEYEGVMRNMTTCVTFAPTSGGFRLSVQSDTTVTKATLAEDRGLVGKRSSQSVSFSVSTSGTSCSAQITALKGVSGATPTCRAA